MAKVIYKYPLNMGETVLDLPIGSVLRAAYFQHGKPTLWFEVPMILNPETIPHHYTVYPTGQPIDPFHEYIATVFAAGGLLVWHIYRDRP